MSTLFCFGLGYSAQHYIAEFGARFDRIAGTVTKREKAAAVAGATIAGTVHIAVVCGCYLLYCRHYPSSRVDFPDMMPALYAGYALCVAPLSMLYGATIGGRWARSRKSASANGMSTASDPHQVGNGSGSRR